MELKDVIDYYGKLNFDVIAITDHILDSVSKKLPKIFLPYNWISNEKEFNEYYAEVLSEAKRAREQYDMLVIPGMEFTNYVSNIHVVCIDIKSFIKPQRRIIDMLKIAKEQKCLLIGAHPFENGGRLKLGSGLWKNEVVSKIIDVWEAGNGVDFFPHTVYNGYKVVGNTDFHGSNKETGILGWKTLINSEKNIDSVKQAIMDQQIALHKFRTEPSIQKKDSNISERVFYGLL
jgi:hypothetical protein